MSKILGNFGLKGRWSAFIVVPQGKQKGVEFGDGWTVESKSGVLLASSKWENIVVNAGLDHVLDATLSAATQITTWYILLLSGTPTVAAADTMASHGGWTEVVAYDEANRQTWTDAGVSGQSVSNTASPAQVTISTDSTTIGGAGLTSNNTKSGTTGTLYAAAAFGSGNVVLNDGSTMDITGTFTAAAA